MLPCKDTILTTRDAALPQAICCQKQKTASWAGAVAVTRRGVLFLVQPVVDHFRCHYGFHKGISPGLGRLDHLDGLGQPFGRSLKGCYGFLSHVLLFYLFVSGHTLEDGVEFFQFHPVGRVLFVLGGDVPGGAGHPRPFVLGAFQDNLYSVAFLCHGRYA